MTKLTIVSSRRLAALARRGTLCLVLLSAPGLAQTPSNPGRDSGDSADVIAVPDVPLPGPGDSAEVSLEQLLAYADQHAPGLLVVRKRTGLADAERAEASLRLPQNPQVSFGAGPRFSDSGTHLDMTASLSQRFSFTGKRGQRREAADRFRDRLQAEVDAARWGIHRDVHAAFHRALVARERLAVARRIVGFQEKLLEIAEGRHRAGDVSPLAVRLAGGELSQARVALVFAEQSHQQSRLELGVLTGWTNAEPPTPRGHLDEPRDPPTVERLLELAQAHQPRLRALRAGAREAEARMSVASRNAWPDPTLGVQFTREGAPTGQEERIVLGTLSLPIPVARRNQGERKRAQVLADIVDAEAAAIERQLVARITQGRVGVAAAAEQLRTYGTHILPTFEENLRLIQRAFELGEIDILQVSVARERFVRIQSEALGAYGRYFQSIAELEGLIGADLWPSEHHDSQPNSISHQSEEP